MEVACSSDIFQAKIYELLGDMEGTKAHIDDILVVKKAPLTNGVQPNPKTIKERQALERPKTVTKVRKLIGMVQYYRDLWPPRSHILEPFTALSAGKKGTKIKWRDELESAFQEVKQVVSK